MTLASLGLYLSYPGILSGLDGVPAISTASTLDAAGEYQSYILEAREDMVLSHVGWRTGTVAGSPTADTRIETVDPATGLPTGTLWATNTNIVSGTLSSNTSTLHALTAPATILKGQVYCVKIVYASGTSVTVIALSNARRLASTTRPYAVTNVTGSAVKSRPGQTFNLALGSSTTTFYAVDNVLPVTAITSSAFNNTNSAARGMHFQVPFKCRCIGLTWYNSSSVGDGNVGILDASGNELSSSLTAFEGDQSGAVTGGSTTIYFDNPVTLSPNTWYYAVVEPSSATNVTVAFGTIPSSSYVSALWGKAFWQYSTRVSGVWTDNADMFPLMDILIDQFDDGASAGHIATRQQLGH